MKTEQLDFDWNCLPVWANWIAMDERGIWHCYKDKPILSNYIWLYRGVSYIDKYDIIHPKYMPRNFTGTWTDSLFENPKYKNDENSKTNI